MTTTVTIAVDAMGGDHGPHVTVPACFSALAESKELNLILVGKEDAISSAIRDLPAKSKKRIASDRYSIVHASQVVEMDDKPSIAMRQKKDSSMRVAANLVKQGKADACVSAGNTGALMAISRFVFKTPRAIDRPAIISTLPTLTGHVHMLDLGANVDCDADNFFQFALMGSILSKALDGNEQPKVGLLNIGEEEIKGNEQVKQANERLIAAQGLFNYIGYVEADAIFEGVADVVVCDGFVGNVALKTMEGMVKLVRENIKEEVTKNLLHKFLSVPTIPIWLGLKKRLNTGKYNGASMIGLKGVAIKSHGNADVDSFAAAIIRATQEVDKGVPKLIEEGVAQLKECV